MQQHTRISCFGVWTNVRLLPYEIQTTNIYKDLFKGYTLKYLTESFLGHEMKKIGTCDGLTDQQKKTRVEWVMKELKENHVLGSDFVYDIDKIILNDSEEISWFLWNLVQYDIKEVWEANKQYLGNAIKLIADPYRWSVKKDISGAKKLTYDQVLNQDKQRKLAEKKKKLKPEEGIIEIISLYVNQYSGTESKCPPVNDLYDLTDTRILLRLLNALYPHSFTPEVLLNDRWTVNLALEFVGDMMGVRHSVDSEDLIHCDVMALLAFFCAILMSGLVYRQAVAVVNRIGIIKDDLIQNSRNLEDLPNIAQDLDTIREKKELTLKIEALAEELGQLEAIHNVAGMTEKIKKLAFLQEEVSNKIGEKINDRFDAIKVPRSTTINNLIKFMYINLNLTSGSAFYTSTGKETISQDRKIVLYDKKEKRFIDDFTGYDCGSMGVRQLLNIPVNTVSEIKAEDYEEKYIIYFESPSRNKLLKAGSYMLYQVFPGLSIQCERALIKAVRNGDFETSMKLISFYKFDKAFVNCSYRETGSTALHYAVKGKHFRLALYLLESGAGVNNQNKILQTPLFHAVDNLDRQMISLLIEWGANIFIRNVSNMDVLKIARNDALKEFIQIKFEQIKNLVSSIANENVDAVNKALNNHHHHIRPFASLRSRIYNGQTILHVAARFGAIPVIEMLLEHKLDINIRDSTGKTALHYVKDLTTTALLLEARADPSLYDDDGNTPLHTLCLGRSVTGDDQLDVGQLFLENGSSVMSRNKKGYLPVHCCACNGRADYIKLLLGVGGASLKRELNSTTPRISSLVRLATEGGFLRCSEWLLRNGFNFRPGEAEKILENLLTSKVSHVNPYDTVHFLINLGADPCYKCPRTDNQPLHLAARQMNFTEIINLLIDMGADIEGENREGETPLFYALKYHNFHGAKVLLDRGANIHHRNNIMLTPFETVEDYEEWINSGILSSDYNNLLRALSLKQNQDRVRRIMTVVRSSNDNPDHHAATYTSNNTRFQKSPISIN